MKSVITYTNISQFGESEHYHRIRDLPHFAMSNSFGNMLKKTGMFSEIATFRDLLNEMTDIWDKPSSRADDLIRISGHIHRLMEDAPDDDVRLWLNGCLRNSYQMWSSIRLLMEADVEPDSIRGFDDNMDLMADLWNMLLSDSNSFKEFVNAFKKEPCHRMDKAMSSLFEDNVSKSIVIHGFYYFTPIQERMLNILEEIGYDLIYLIPYDGRYPFCYEVWEDLYSEPNNLPSKDEWIITGSSVDNVFGDIMEGRDPGEYPLKFIEFENIMRFTEFFSSNTGPETLVVSPDPKESNDILRRFYPEKFMEHNLLSYPIGRFIHSLYSMWDDESNRIVLVPRMVMDCFVTGWITYEGKRSDSYVMDLMDILPFFKGCTTLKDWNERLSLLRNIESDVIAQFRSDSVDPVQRRWENVLNNPFSMFCMFNVSPDRLDVVINMINRILDCVSSLFDIPADSSIGFCIEELLRLLYGMIADDESMGSEFERAKAALSNLESLDSSEGFLPSDVSAAIRLLLNNGLDLEDSLSDPVHHMYDIQSVSSGTVHVCLSDFSRLPGSRGEPSWPLSYNMVLSLYSKGCGDLLRNTIFITSHSPASNRYLLFRSFFADEVILSWISNLDGKPVERSPYISLISESMGLSIHDYPGTFGCNEQSNQSEVVMQPIPPSSFDMIDDARMEFSLCPRRFLYSYVLKENPTYRSEFTHSHIIGALINAFKDLNPDMDPSLIEESVLELFPNLRRSEKQSILDLSRRSKESGFTPYNGRLYTDKRLDVHFLGYDRYNLNESLDDIDWNEPVNLFDSNNKKCMYCPHTSYCKQFKLPSEAD